MSTNFAIPDEVSTLTAALESAGFEAYLVGGCVRDLVLSRPPKDWDVTTNATPEQIQATFPHTFYENDFGTVGVVNDDVSREMDSGDVSRETLHVIEVTPYRLESEYSDFRRPDSVIFSQNLKDDLKRRDFTINALAYSVSRGTLIDEFGGLLDLQKRLVRTVGDPGERFAEDALRLLRAVRLAAELDLDIEPATNKALAELSILLEKISVERIRTETVRIIESPDPVRGFTLARNLGLNQYIFPELEEGVGCEQMSTHAYDVWEHNLRSLEYAVERKYEFHVKLAALLHDVGKPRTKRKGKRKPTFYGHDVVGARMAKKMLDRLKFSRETTDIVVKLVRHHLFFSDPDAITLSAVRRMVANVGKDLIWDLMKLRQCDRIGTGRPKAHPWRLRKYEAMIDQVLRDPISVKMLKMDGGKLMKVTRETPGPRIGWVLHALLEEVLDDPTLNNDDYMVRRSAELAKLSDKELMKIGEAGKETRKEAEDRQIKEINRAHGVH